MLVLELELLTGAYRAVLPDGSAAEWPPHPERVFSALVQAWSDGGGDPGEQGALEWLERQSLPLIEADPDNFCTERDLPVVYVPPNDPRGDEIAVLPERRRRQARGFRAVVPSEPLIRLIWTDAHPSSDQRTALDILAGRMASIGHSASLVRGSFIDKGETRPERLWRPAADGRVALRVPHPGRLANLSGWFAADERPRVGASVRYRDPGEISPLPPPHSTFGGPDNWFVFEEIGGFRPDILGFAQVAKRVRDSLMSLAEQPVLELISGHVADGGATTKPHLAVLPLANVGWNHAGGDLLGFAVVLPRTLASEERMQVLQALSRFAGFGDEGDPVAKLNFGPAGVWNLEHTTAPSRQSLWPDRWCKADRIWASATPVLLDRFPDQGDDLEAATLIAGACVNIGLPEPEEIELHKYSAVTGAPPAYPARGQRSRPDWSFPRGARFARRPRRHVVLRFAEPVAGPVILGAGRFHGFGLCLPIGGGSKR